MDDKISLRDMLAYAGQGLEQAGYRWHRVKGAGRKRAWMIEKGGKAMTAAVRTTQDRWFAFPRKEDGWKTLDEIGAELVVVAAVDNPDRPRSIEVYLFPADEVRQRFNANYEAKAEAGHAIVTVHEGRFGMWVPLDKQPSGSPSAAGSGLAQDYPPIATVPIAGADVSEHTEQHPEPKRPSGSGAPSPVTIGDVLDEARRKIADIAGRPIDKVSLELRIG